MQAKESVRKSLETQSPIERQRWLGESLRYVLLFTAAYMVMTLCVRLFMKGARILDMEKLREICGDYQHLKYAKGMAFLHIVCNPVLTPDSRSG